MRRGACENVRAMDGAFEPTGMYSRRFSKEKYLRKQNKNPPTKAGGSIGVSSSRVVVIDEKPAHLIPVSLTKA